MSIFRLRSAASCASILRRVPVSFLAGIMLLLTGVCGCHSRPAEMPPDPAADLSLAPLTAEVWKLSEDQEKYSPEVLKRLRAEDPSLKSKAQWTKFYEEVVVPGFKRDVAGPMQGPTAP